MGINTTYGILKGHAFYDNSIQLHNILFYCFFAISTIIFLWYIIKLWKDPLDFEL
jgi:hypothetical protein